MELSSPPSAPWGGSARKGRGAQEQALVPTNSRRRTVTPNPGVQLSAVSIPPSSSRNGRMAGEVSAGNPAGRMVGGSAVRRVPPGRSGGPFQVPNDFGESARHDLPFFGCQTGAGRTPELPGRFVDRFLDRTTSIGQVEVNATSVDGVSASRDEPRGDHVGGHLRNGGSRNPQLPSDLDGRATVFLVEGPKDVVLPAPAPVLLHDLIDGGPRQFRHAHEIVPKIRGRHEYPPDLLPREPLNPSPSLAG
jgi:hypothetical protein